MQTVSEKWDKNQESRIITAPSFLELSILVTDPEAAAEAESSCTNEEFYSQGNTIANGIAKLATKYATLEHNIWCLDGTLKIIPDSSPYGDNGYVGSVLSGSDCTFSPPPVITVSFSKVYTNPLQGITLNWSTKYDNEWAESFIIKVYNGSTVTASKTVTGNQSAKCFVTIDIETYDRIELTVTKWNLPYRRTRMESFAIGIEHIFHKEDVMKYQHTMESDILSAELPKVEVSFKFKNIERTYNPDNSNGLSKYLMEQQEIKVKYGYVIDGSLELIEGATVYLSEWETPSNDISATFTARDLLSYMEEMYTGPSSGSLYSIAEAALTQADLPVQANGLPRWDIHTSLKNINAPSGVDLSRYTFAEIVQLCANAGCCVMYQDREGILRIKPFSGESTGYSIAKFIEYGYPETRLSKPLKAVNINDGAYILQVSSDGAVQPVNNPLISSDQAPTVAAWVKDMLILRQTVNGEWRSDPKVDVLDVVAVDTPFKTNNVVLTRVEYTFNGMFTGKYEGRVR